MKRTIIAFSLVVLALIGFGTWVYNAEKEQRTASILLHKQNVVITSVEVSLDALEAEVTVQQAEEGGYPVLEILLTNNGKEDVYIEGYDVYYRDGINWEKRIGPSEVCDLLIDGTVLCSDSVATLKEFVDDPEEITNTRSVSESPWKSYQYMEYNGEYRMEYTIVGEDTKETGTLAIEWTQENK